MAITIQQPWIELILAGFKRVENRSWRSSHRGLILLHAAKKFDEKWKERCPSLKALSEAQKYINRKTISYRGRIPYPSGAIVGAAIQAGCDTVLNNSWCEAGRYYHRYVSVIRFERPIPCHGRMKIWTRRMTPVEMANQDWEAIREMLAESIRRGWMESEKEEELDRIETETKSESKTVL